MNNEFVGIVHLSDLHFGLQGRFANWPAKDVAACCEGSVRAVLQSLGAPEELQPILVVTGDITQSAHPSEYAKAHEFFEVLLERLALDRRRLVLCPGNHDVSWLECKIAELEQQRQTQSPDPAVVRAALDAAKLGPFLNFRKKLLGELTGSVLGGGGEVHDFADERISIAALNSCERESHRAEDHLGRVSEEQISAIVEHWSQPNWSAWIKVVALHHPPEAPTRSNAEQTLRKMWAQESQLEPALIQAYLAELAGLEGASFLRNMVATTRAHLVLHGHQHANDARLWPWTQKGFAHVMSAGSAFVAPDELPTNQQNSIRVILLDRQAEAVRAEVLTFSPQFLLELQVRSGGFVRTERTYHQQLCLEQASDRSIDQERDRPRIQLCELAEMYERIRQRNSKDEPHMREVVTMALGLLRSDALSESEIKAWFSSEPPDKRRGDINGRRLLAVVAMSAKPGRFFEQLLSACTDRASKFEQYHALNGLRNLLLERQLSDSEIEQAIAELRGAFARNQFDAQSRDQTRYQLARDLESRLVELARERSKA